jgi:hypothetical protein
MANPYEIREGYHEVMNFTLTHKIGNDYLAFDLTGYSRVFLKRKSHNGKTE